MTVDDIPEGMVVTVGQLRAAGFCVRGQRQFADAHDIDFRAFVDAGFPARDLFAIGDGSANRALESLLRIE